MRLFIATMLYSIFYRIYNIFFSPCIVVDKTLKDDLHSLKSLKKHELIQLRECGHTHHQLQSILKKVKDLHSSTDTTQSNSHMRRYS